jgi:hypothetical protein
MDDLEKLANLNGLNEEQTNNLKNVCCMFYIQSENIKKGSFHEIKYKTYNLDYFLKEVKSGKTPLEIMNTIITECEEYSKAQIFQKHFNISKS